MQSKREGKRILPLTLPDFGQAREAEIAACQERIANAAVAGDEYRLTRLSDELVRLFQGRA